MTELQKKLSSLQMDKSTPAGGEGGGEEDSNPSGRPISEVSKLLSVDSCRILKLAELPLFKFKLKLNH